MISGLQNEANACEGTECRSVAVQLRPEACWEGLMGPTPHESGTGEKPGPVCQLSLNQR